jgi:phosphatidylglycerol:prolipoprotein diacylglycerol transferase
MNPYFNFLGREVPAFGVMVLLGVAVGSFVIYLNCKINRVKLSDPMLTACMAFVGVIIGSRLLKPLINIPDIITNWEKYAQVPLGEFLHWFFGETVFYGGLLGGFAAAYIFCRCFKIPFLPTVDILAPAIPAGHALGRIGCLLGGCCYGIEVGDSHPFAVVYPERTDGFSDFTAPSGVPLLSIQVIEAVGNLTIAAILILFSFAYKKKVAGQCIALYGLLYAIQRFVLEFFRGDSIRGIYGGISTSQIISLIIIIASITIIIFGRIKSKEIKL